MAKNLEGGGHELGNGMIVSEEFYDKLGGKPEKKIDVKRIKRDKNTKDINSEAGLGLGEEEILRDKERVRKHARIKKNNEKLRKKTESGYTGGSSLYGEEKTIIADNSDKNKTNKESGWWKERRDVIKVKPDDVMEDLPKIKKNEAFQEGEKDEDADIIKSKNKKLVTWKGKESNLGEDEIYATDEMVVEARERIAARFRAKESNQVAQGEKPEKIDTNNLEARQEMEELAKQLSPELKQEFLEKNEEATREGDEIALERLKAENKELYNHSKGEFRLIEELDIKNAELKANLEKVSNHLSAMESAIEKSSQEFETKDDSKFEKVKGFFNNPKVKLAITVGLMGAAYTVGGGAPAILAFKPLLAKIGIGYIPYTYGVSSWGGGAIAGGAGRWVGEKLGLVKNENDAKTAVKEVLENIKNSGNEERSVGETLTEEKIGKTEGKKEKFLNKIFGDWGRKKKLSIKQVPEVKTGEENKEEMTEMLKEEAEKFNLFIGAFKNKKKNGKDVFEYLGKLSGIYCKDSSKYCDIFYAEILNQEKHHSHGTDELRIALIDSMVDYLRKNDMKEKKESAKQLMTVLFPLMGAEPHYLYAGKKENVEWLGWEYKGAEK